MIGDKFHQISWSLLDLMCVVGMCGIGSIVVSQPCILVVAMWATTLQNIVGYGV
jgi:hypothetical protein